jgi:hypothetical protein
MNYYFQCSSCKQTDKNKICYANRKKVIEHLKSFDELFKPLEDDLIGRLESIGEDHLKFEGSYATK